MDFTIRQIEIIEAATKLIGEKGIQNLTIKNLAKEMAFSEPALYRHFKNKIEILKSVLIYYKVQLKEKLSAIVASEINEVEKIIAIMDFQFSHFSKNPAIIMVIFSETSFQFNNELSKTVATIMEQKGKMIESILKSGQSKGFIRADIEPTQLVALIMGSMRFTILKWRLSEDKIDLVSEGLLLKRTIEIVLKEK